MLRWPRILPVTLDNGEKLHQQRPPLKLKCYCVVVNRCTVSLNPTFLYVKQEMWEFPVIVTLELMVGIPQRGPGYCS